MPNVAPNIRGLPSFAKADKNTLVDLLEHYRSLSKEQIRRAVIERNRIDILAFEVLGYEVQPFHLKMLKFQFLHKKSLQLSFRGAGKTTICTIAKAIHYLIKNRNLRIAIASKTKTNAETFLKEIKGHFEHNEKLIDIFGEFYDPRRVGKWDNSEIEVLGRTKHMKESSITCLGVDSAVVSRHYDIHLPDDIIDDSNSRTKHMRGLTHNWWYQSFLPTLEPPDVDIPERGDSHALGTHYHFDDHYEHLKKHELADHHQVIPALDEDDNSPWPSKFPSSHFLELRETMGTILFNAQYQCNTEAMKGEIFSYDDCQELEDKEMPTGGIPFMGVDLAISEGEKNDLFAICVGDFKGRIGTDAVEIYTKYYYEGRIRFSAQTEKIIEVVKEFKPKRLGISAVAYELAQYQELKKRPEMIGTKMIILKPQNDKMSRAWKLTPIFEGGRVFFRKTIHNKLIDQFVLFPNHAHDDGFEAFDNMVSASKARIRRKTRSQEPGVM